MKIKIMESGNPGNYLKINDLDKPELPCVVSFYRSKEHAEGKYGADDKTYKGNFGFDRFDKDVMGQGLASEYEVVEGVKTKKETVNADKRHLASYISLYPSGKPSPGHKSEVEVIVRLEKSDKYKNSDPDLGRIHFESSDPASLELVSPMDMVDGKKVYSLMLTMKKKDDNSYSDKAYAYGKLKIRCIKEFSEPVKIDAIRRVKNEEDRVVGRLIAYPNAVRYTTQIQPVKLNLGAVAGTKAKPIPNSAFMRKVVKEFNEKSFNQAFIKGTIAPKTYEITLMKDDIKPFLDYTQTRLKDKATAVNYNTFVERRLAALLVNEDAKNKAEQELMEKGAKMLEIFDKKFSYPEDGSLKKAKKGYDDKMVKNIWGHKKVQEAYEEYEKSQDAYDKLGNTETDLDKTHKIHVFYTDDIDAAYPPAAAYSAPSSGVVHLFKELLDKEDENVAGALHEMGHSLGLSHTFSDEMGSSLLRTRGVVYQQDVKKQLEKLKAEQSSLKTTQTNLRKAGKKKATEMLDDTELGQLDSLNTKYFGLERTLKLKKFYKIYEYKNFINLYLNPTIKLEEKLLSEGENDLQTLEELETEINKLGKEIKDAKDLLNGTNGKSKAEEGTELPRKKSISTTEENYMDYRDGNTNMDRKVYYKWQWDEMRKIGLEKNYIKEKK